MILILIYLLFSYIFLYITYISEWRPKIESFYYFILIYIFIWLVWWFMLIIMTKEKIQEYLKKKNSYLYLVDEKLARFLNYNIF